MFLLVSYVYFLNARIDVKFLHASIVERRIEEKDSSSSNVYNWPIIQSYAWQGWEKLLA